MYASDGTIRVSDGRTRHVRLGLRAGGLSRRAREGHARVACAPHELEALVGAAVEAADDAAGARSVITRGRAFRPSYPKPVHRLLADPQRQ